MLVSTILELLDPERMLTCSFLIIEPGIDDLVDSYLSVVCIVYLCIHIECPEVCLDFLSFTIADFTGFVEDDDISKFHLLDEEIDDTTTILFIDFPSEVPEGLHRSKISLK